MKPQPEILVIEQLRIWAGITVRAMCEEARVPALRYLEATQGRRDLSKYRLKALTRALASMRVAA